LKIVSIKDPKKFFEQINKLKGEVELVTSEGDRLNLKSVLCQYIALTQMFKDAMIDDVELLFSDPSEAQFVSDYIVTTKDLT